MSLVSHSTYPAPEYDVFISHASEDKDSFVRELAHALEARRLRPWYDEFTLRPGDSLRRSIDHGLLTSQAGVIILSPAFFAKRWPAYELDGLVELHAGMSEQVAGLGQGGRIIPVWHGVDAAAVRRHSPSLANLVAIKSEDGIEAAADRILNVLRPTGSTLLFAYAELSKLCEPHSWQPHIVTDDWWLDAVEASAGNDIEGTFQEAMGWGHWGFPLPEASKEPRERGHRLARAAAQMIWQRADAKLSICQVTPPEEVLDFIASCPGLAEVCIEHPSYLLSYAPQLVLPDVAGWLQPIVDEVYEWARDRVRAGGLNPDQPQGRERLARDFSYLALRDVQLIEAAPSHAACGWVQGDIHGPTVNVYEPIDYAGWLASEKSVWLDDSRRSALLTGIAKWAVWPTWREEQPPYHTETLLEALDSKGDSQAMRKKVRPILTSRLESTVSTLGLSETASTLADRLLEAGFVEEYGRKHRRK